MIKSLQKLTQYQNTSKADNRL